MLDHGLVAERFQSTLRAESVGGASLVVPLDVPAVFGRVRTPVVVRINNYAWRTTIMRYGGEYIVGINRAAREGAGIKPGDRVTVELEPDFEPRTVAVPADLAAALGEESRARFEALSFTHRREHVEAIEGAKRPETRARRIAKVVDALRTG
jgi:uncharacterized protein YdeI (YjbR/CyaY-like superfamily)